MMSNIGIKKSKEFIKQNLEEFYKSIDEDWIIVEKYLSDCRIGEYWIEFNRKSNMKNYIIFYGNYKLIHNFKSCKIKINYNGGGSYEFKYDGKIAFEKIGAILESLCDVDKLSGKFEKIIKGSEKNE